MLNQLTRSLLFRDLKNILNRSEVCVSELYKLYRKLQPNVFNMLHTDLKKLNMASFKDKPQNIYVRENI